MSRLTWDFVSISPEMISVHIAERKKFDAINLTEINLSNTEPRQLAKPSWSTGAAQDIVFYYELKDGE